MTEPISPARAEFIKTLINRVYDIAAAVTEPGPEVDLELVSLCLDDAHAAATGKRTQDDVDRLVAEFMFSTLSRVEIDEDAPAWKRDLQQQAGEAWLGYLGDKQGQALLDRMRWADAADPVEPWDAPASDRELPAPSSPDTALLGVAYPEASEPDFGDGAEPWDAAPEPDSGDEAEPWDTTVDEEGRTDDGDPEADVIEGEIVEVDQVTSAQRRYRMPVGQYYSPDNRPAWSRSIGGGGRPVTHITTASPYLDDQR